MGAKFSNRLVNSMQKHLDEALKRFNDDLLQMAALTEGAIHKSIQALRDRDQELAERVIIEDKKIDNLENIIEEATVELLALFQPRDVDLRFISTGRSICGELERIADLVVDICQRILDIVHQPVLKPLEDISQLADNVKMMVHNTIDAFIKKDEDLAVNVILADKESERLRTLIMKELIDEHLMKDGTTADRAVPLLMIARDLERISDFSSSIAEDVIYMVQARAVRHHP